jgi:hypothetical protein
MLGSVRPALVPIRVFIASPADVREERECADQVVAELNRTVGARLNIVLEAVRWETHSWPGIGEDVQEIINRQLGFPDIFVGIMWRRIGTRTPRADSGTVEEFDRALQSHRSPAQSKPAILFYMCRRPFFARTLDDVRQMTRVLRFRKRLTKEGSCSQNMSTFASSSDRFAST